MATKLTLRMDEQLIKLAKNYARQSGKSLSKLVADFFAILNPEPEEDPSKISPNVKSLQGIMRDYRVTPEDYKRYLEKKHL
jgi:hypothetical protein